MKKFLCLFASGVLVGCGGGGAPETIMVEPRITVHFPERNRDVFTNEMTSTVQFTFWDSTNSEPIYGPFFARRTLQPSSAFSQVFSFPKMPVGNYYLITGGWSSLSASDQLTANTSDAVSVNADGTITRRNGDAFAITQAPPVFREFQPIFSRAKAGSTASAFTTAVWGDGISERREVPNAWVRFEWIEGRELLEIFTQNSEFIRYELKAPGTVRYRVNIGQYRSPEFSFVIEP